MSDRYDDGRGIAMLIAGFGLGTLVGTVIGMLIAPKAGRELRADIAEYSKDYYDKARQYGRETYEKGRERAREAYEAGREQAKDYSARLGEKLSAAKEQVGETAQRLGTAVKSGVEKAMKGGETTEEAGEEAAKAK
jgi:gas vesicle protein